jgi:HNH endonuclease
MVARTPPSERFWAKINKGGPIPEHRSDLGPCWLWTAATNYGYGVFRIDRRSIYAHRYAYELLVGPIPDGLQLDHLCRVPPCVNPTHLEPVTHRENILRGTTYINSLKAAARRPALRPPRRPLPPVPRTPSPYGNPNRDPRTGRFATAQVVATSRRLARLIQFGTDADALERRDPPDKLTDPDGNEVEVKTAALAILHAHVNRLLSGEAS